MPSSGKAYEHIARSLNQEPSISILETPAGFELNSTQVADQVRQFLLRRLRNYQPKIQLIPARKKGTALSPDNPEILEPILRSNWIFMGPGSPTYAVNQLKDSLALIYLRAAHLLGSSVTLASAAVLAISHKTLPVYEIYKVGEEPHWKDGLDYFSIFGLKLVFIPHWNNSDGGAVLDTSRCFMGKSRFEILLSQLPDDIVLIGIDEQTAICLDFQTHCLCQVFGKGTATIRNGGHERIITHGQAFTLENFPGFQMPESKQYISKELKQIFKNARQNTDFEPDKETYNLIKLREEARFNQDWQKSDELRNMIKKKGWKIKDTLEGPQIGSIDYSAD